MTYQGDWVVGSVHDFFFETAKISDGSMVTLAGTPSLEVYKDNSTTQSTAGLTLSVDFDSRTGKHKVRVDTSADGTFYSAGSEFNVSIAAGTVDSVSVVGRSVGHFSLYNRSALRPTTSGRTLDVSAGGEAGIDWANIGSPTTVVNLSATNIDTDQVVASVTGAVGSVAAGGITASSIATNAIDADAIAADAVTEIQSGLSTLDAAGVRSAVGLASANLDTQLSEIDNFVDTEVAAIKAKTDQLTFGVSNTLNTNVTHVNEVEVAGAGTAGNPWGPA